MLVNGQGRPQQPQLELPEKARQHETPQREARMRAKVPEPFRDTATPQLFLRNATGLIKGWSRFDAFVYSYMSVNFVTLGLYFSLSVLCQRPLRNPGGWSGDLLAGGHQNSRPVAS